jgi:hypothetical protein
MWWLSFRHGGALIMAAEASSLAHARMLAAIRGLGRVSHVEGGHFINPEHAALIPEDSIGRMLAPDEVRRLRALLGYTRGEGGD